MSHTRLVSTKLRIITFIMVCIVLASATAEAKLSQTDVSQLYVSIFNRASEGEGNAYWQSAWPDLATTANKMLDTDAAKNYFGASLNSNQAFIEHIYLNTLNKTISDDPAGIAHWVGQLNGGNSRGQVVATLVGVIKDYAPGGKYFDPNDAKTIAAYKQFTNRVTVSNYMAETVYATPHDWETITKFSLTGLNVTDNDTTVTGARNAINLIAGGTGLTGDIEKSMAMVSSVGALSPMMDEISTVLEEIMNGNSKVVTFNPRLTELNLEKLPSTITITADFGSGPFGVGYTPVGSASVFTGQAVINITNLIFSDTGITADAAITATNVKRNGQLILNGGMTLGLNIGISGSDMTVIANVIFSNMQSLDFQINGGLSVSVPSFNSEAGTFQPMTITFNQLTTQDFQFSSGTITLTQNGDLYDALFNLNTDQGTVTGTLQVDNSNADQTVISTPGTFTVGQYNLDINNVIMAPATCSELPISGNIVITGSSETKTVTFNSCTYTIN